MPAIIEDEKKLLPEGAERSLQAAFDAALEREGVNNAAAALLIVDDEEILELNRRMRGIDKVTDVLSFPNINYPAGVLLRDRPELIKKTYEPDLGAYFLGDIALNVKRAREQAEEYGHSLLREVCYLTVHALLHLCGYDHVSDEDRSLMREREEAVMERIELGR